MLFFLEGRSERELLLGLLPRILPNDVDFQLRQFEGKQDLEKNLVVQLRNWRRPNTRFVVLRDQDSEDCHAIKQRLTELCRRAGREEAVVRIACHEVESWYLGDLAAIEAGLGISGLAKQQQAAKYRNPDSRPSPADELATLTKQKYQKVSGSRALGKTLSLAGNRSRSFAVFIEGVRRLASL